MNPPITPPILTIASRLQPLFAKLIILVFPNIWIDFEGQYNACALCLFPYYYDRILLFLRGPCFSAFS